jgi:hypothetical protein
MHVYNVGITTRTCMVNWVGNMQAIVTLVIASR